MVSVLLTKFNWVKIARFAHSQYFIIGLNFIVLAILYAGLNSFVFSKGFASQILMFLGEKALLSFQGNSFQIENSIFVYPPLPYIFFLLLRNPFMSSAVVGGITVSILLYYLWKHLYIKKRSPRIFFISVVYLCASPLSIYIFSENVVSCLMFFFILLCLHLFYNFYKDQLIINLFLFGILSAAIFFIHFEVSFIVSIWALSLLITKKRTLNNNLIPVLVITFFPLIFFVLGWFYINWLHTNDFFHFIHPWKVTICNPKFNSNLLYSNPYFPEYFYSRFKIFLNNFPFIIPSTYLALLIIFVKKLRNFIFFQILIFPFILICTDLIWGTLLTKSGNHIFLMFIFTSNYVFIQHPRFSLYPIVKKFYIFLLLLSFCFSLWVPLYTGSIEEKQFIRCLYSFSDYKNFNDEKKLLEKIQDKGKILLDDSILYPLVFLSDNPKRFVLPYESEFELALAKPELFVEYIIISSYGEKDNLLTHISSDYFSNIKNFYLIEQYQNLFLYKIYDSRLPSRRLKY
jgi:hypothetical protein